MLYEYPDYAAFGGGIGASFLGVLSISGGIAGEADFGDGLFNLHGSVRTCIHLIDDLCSGATGNVSRGRGGTGGAGACVQLGPVSVGGGVQWQRISEPFIWPFDGCKWSRFRATVREAGVRTANAGEARAAGPVTVDVESGQSPALQLSGAEAAPFIRVSGPGGSLESHAGTGFARSPDSTIRIMRFENAQAKFAVVGFQNAKPGRYTIEPLPGSAAITEVKRAFDPPPAEVEGRVRGRGTRRVLHYSVRDRQDQQVIFQEIGPGGTARRIGTITGGGRGQLRFTTAPGRGARKVVAQFVLAGINAERKVFARFTPPSARLPRAKRVRVRRKGSRLIVSWRGVRGAKTYEVAATTPAGLQRFAVSRRPRATVTRVPQYLGGRATVRAVDGVLRQSMPAGRRFKARRRQPSPFRPLLHCALRRRDIVCRPSPRRFGSARAACPSGSRSAAAASVPLGSAPPTGRSSAATAPSSRSAAP